MHGFILVGIQQQITYHTVSPSKCNSAEPQRHRRKNGKLFVSFLSSSEILLCFLNKLFLCKFCNSPSFERLSFFSDLHSLSWWSLSFIRFPSELKSLLVDPVFSQRVCFVKAVLIIIYFRNSKSFKVIYFFLEIRNKSQLFCLLAFIDSFPAFCWIYLPLSIGLVW